MNRRAFLGGAAASPLALVVAAAPSNFGWPVAAPLPSLPASAHVLGPEPTDSTQRLVRMMSDDVFTQLVTRFRRAYPAKALRVVEGQYLGDRGLAVMWHAAVEVDGSYAGDRPPEFPLTDFRARTASWCQGPMLCFGSPSPEHATPITTMFDGRTRVGMGILPAGLLWAAHYLDEDTGLAMRAVAQFQIQTDRIAARWDVLCG